jgi:hypothetical protein
MPLPATALVALALLAGAGCSEEPASSAATDVDQAFSKEELADMRKSVTTVDEFRELKRLKLAERTGGGSVKLKMSTPNPKPK